MKRYIKNVILILSIVASFVAINILDMPNRVFSYTYALAEKYVFTTKEEVPSFTVGSPTLVPGTKSDGTKYDKMYINKLGEIRVPITRIENVSDKNDFNVKVTRNGRDVTSSFIITKTNIANKAMTITLTMKDGGNYEASSYLVTVSVDHEWEESTESETTTSARVKIIRDESIGTLSWGTTATNDWNKASLQAILNGRYYNATGAYDEIGLTEESQNLISKVNWNIGGNDNTYRDTAEDFYSAERGDTGAYGSTSQWEGYVGLMYPSDFGFAVGGTNRNTCLQTALNSYSDSCDNDDWLSGSHSWTMTPTKAMDYQVHYVATDVVSKTASYGTYGVQPVVYLDTDVVITGGSGTEQDPYTLKKSAITTNNLVQKIKTLAKTDTTNLANDETEDNNIRYIGSNPNNYVEFNGELWRIIGVMNNIEGNDGENLEYQSNVISKTTSFSLVDKYYNFEAEIEQKTNYPNNPSNRSNIWEITLDEFEGITTSNFTYTLKNNNNTDSTSKFNITSNITNNKVTYRISNKTIWLRPKAGTYTFTVSYSNTSYSNSRGTLTKTFTIKITGRETSFAKQAEESHQYIRTMTPTQVSIQVYNMTNSNISFREGTSRKTMSIENFNKEYSGAALQNVGYNEDGDVVYEFIVNSNNYSIYKVTNTEVSYIHNESEEQDSNGNKIDHFTVSKEDFETKFPGKLGAFATAGYSSDNAGDVYCNLSATKEIELKTLDTANKPINAAGGGVFSFEYKYTGLTEEDFTENLTYKIYKINNNSRSEITAKDGFTIENRIVTSISDETGILKFNLNYDNKSDSYIGDYSIEFYIDDGNETITLTAGFSLYEGEMDYAINHSTDSSVLTNNSNKQIEHYIRFDLRKGSAKADTINPNNIGIKIYDSFADLDENGNVYYYDLINYELDFVNKKDNNITYRVYEDGKEVSGSPFTTTLEEFKESKYFQAAKLIDNYKFDASTGNLITSSTNYKENANTSIEIISSAYSSEVGDAVVVYTENGTRKESTYADFKTKYPNMYAYLTINIVFDQNGNNVIGRVMGNYRANEGTKVGHEVTDQFNIAIDQSGTNLDKAITILPKTEVNPQIYYAYISYGNLIGLGHVNNDPDSLITKAEFPDMWEQNNHMTMMLFDSPEYGIEFGESRLSNEGDDTETIYDNINGEASFDLTISDTFNFENKYSYAIYYHENSEDNLDEIDWGTPIQTDKSPNKMFDVNSEIFSIIERTELTPLETNLTVSTIENVAHPKGVYKIVLSYSNNGVTNTGEKTFKIDGKYYGLVLDKDKTDDLSFILNYSETKSIVFDGYYIGNYDNINIRMIQENSSGDIELTREKTNNTSGKFKSDGSDKFTYQIVKEEIDANHSIYTFKLTNIKGMPQSSTYHLYFSYKEEGGEETSVIVDFVVNPATYMWEIDEEDIPTANGKTLYFTKEINTTYIEDFNQFEFKVMGFNGTGYVDVSSSESKNKEFESVELIDRECTGLDCTAKVKITLKEDTDKKKDYYLTSEYLNKDDETDIGDLEELFNWDIANVKISGSYYDSTNNQDYAVDGFFKNVEDTTIDISIDTVQTEKVNWELNRACLSTGYACEVNNPATTKYNDFLTEVSNENKHLKLRLNAEYLKEHSDEFRVQDYSLVLYYGENDYRIYTLEVHGNYVLVKFGNSLVYSTTSGANGVKNVDGLFKNKNGFIYVPVTIIGVDYDDPGVNISLKNANGDRDYLGRPFEFDREQFNEDQTIDIRYLATSANIAVAQDYYLMVEYNNGEETFSDRLDFRLNEKYFNYEISAPKYDPNPLIPNKGGKITFGVTTEDIPNIQYGPGNIESESEKYTMMNNARIVNNKGEDVTSKFTKTVANTGGNNTFDLTLAFVEGAVDPGDYTLKMSYELEGYTLEKEKSFSIGNYAKELEISRVEIISTTTDNRMHKNVDGTYRLHFESAYNINPGYIVVNIFNGETNITNKFNVSVQDHYIDIKYSASTNLEAGDFNVVITYQDDDMPEAATTVTQGIKLYGNYKQIDLSNLNSSAPTIYADRENQYYTFDVNKQPIIDDLENLKWIVTDAGGKDVTNKFKITNNLGDTDAGDNFKLDIIPFAVPVGTYHVRLYLLADGTEDKDEERMYSNTLDITIDDTYYKVNMNNTSTLSQVKNYNTSDKTSIYDRDGAKGSYRFTSTYPIDDLSKYTVAITDVNGNIIKELDAQVTNNDGTLAVDFNTGAISEIGDYKVMICINHLPYTGLNMKVVKFIPVTKVTLKINNTSVGSSYTAYSNSTYRTEFVVEPNNATNKNFTLQSSNTNIATISGTNIVTKNGGTSNITLTNGDMSITVTLNVQDRLSSSVYTINHTDRTIFVSTMSKKELTKNEFINNIKGYTSYQILDSSNKDITKTVTNIGTSMGLKVSGITYKIIVIGDVTGDGKVNTGDVSMLFQHIRKKKTITDKYKLKAGSVRKQSSTNTGDVSKLFQFVRGKINRL